MTEEREWAAMRSEYAAGGVSQRELARRHGVSLYAVRKRAADEGWTAATSRSVRRDGGAEVGNADDEIAVRVRKILLRKLERAANIIPYDATELKTQEDSTVKLLKLRDLTAAYKELVGDADDPGREERRVIVDV